MFASQLPNMFKLQVKTLGVSLSVDFQTSKKDSESNLPLPFCQPISNTDH